MSREPDDVTSNVVFPALLLDLHPTADAKPQGTASEDSAKEPCSSASLQSSNTINPRIDVCNTPRSVLSDISCATERIDPGADQEEGVSGFDAATLVRDPTAYASESHQFSQELSLSSEEQSITIASNLNDDVEISVVSEDRDISTMGNQTSHDDQTPDAEKSSCCELTKKRQKEKAAAVSRVEESYPSLDADILNPRRTDSFSKYEPEELENFEIIDNDDFIRPRVPEFLVKPLPTTAEEPEDDDKTGTIPSRERTPEAAANLQPGPPQANLSPERASRETSPNSNNKRVSDRYSSSEGYLTPDSDFAIVDRPTPKVSDFVYIPKPRKHKKTDTQKVGDAEITPAALPNEDCKTVNREESADENTSFETKMKYTKASKAEKQTPDDKDTKIHPTPSKTKAPPVDSKTVTDGNKANTDADATDTEGTPNDMKGYAAKTALAVAAPTDTGGTPATTGSNTSGTKPAPAETTGIEQVIESHVADFCPNINKMDRTQKADLQHIPLDLLVAKKPPISATGENISDEFLSLSDGDQESTGIPAVESSVGPKPRQEPVTYDKDEKIEQKSLATGPKPRQEPVTYDKDEKIEQKSLATKESSQKVESEGGDDMESSSRGKGNTFTEVKEASRKEERKPIQDQNTKLLADTDVKTTGTDALKASLNVPHAETDDDDNTPIRSRDEHVPPCTPSQMEAFAEEEEECDEEDTSKSRQHHNFDEFGDIVCKRLSQLLVEDEEDNDDSQFNDENFHCQEIPEDETTKNTYDINDETLSPTTEPDLTICSENVSSVETKTTLSEENVNQNIESRLDKCTRHASESDTAKITDNTKSATTNQEPTTTTSFMQERNDKIDASKPNYVCQDAENRGNVGLGELATENKDEVPSENIDESPISDDVEDTNQERNQSEEHHTRQVKSKEQKETLSVPIKTSTNSTLCQQSDQDTADYMQTSYEVQKAKASERTQPKALTQDEDSPKQDTQPENVESETNATTQGNETTIGRSHSPSTEEYDTDEKEREKDIAPLLRPLNLKQIDGLGQDDPFVCQPVEAIRDITPTVEANPELEALPELANAEEDSAVQFQTSGRRSVTWTESDLDISEQRDDLSTDSMYADDEDEETMEILFTKTYTEPVEGAEVFLSCTVVNSAYKDKKTSSEEPWLTDEAIELLEGNAAEVMSTAFMKAKKEMQDIQVCLKSLREQMKNFDGVDNVSLPDLDSLSPDYYNRKAVTD